MELLVGEHAPAPAASPPSSLGIVPTLKLGRREFDDDATLMMAIVNRTPDSFYDKGSTWAEDKAFERVAQVVDEGAEIVDIGGIKAAPGVEIDAAEERRRVVGFVTRVRAAYPDLVISVDTWRAEVADAVCAEGADVLNDAWGGADPALVDVAAKHGAAVVCTHTGGVPPRTRPFRVEYADVVGSAIADTTAYAERAVAAGVDRRSVVVDPAHDFGKNTLHSLEITRRLGEMTATGWPVLVSLSNKDFVGETLDLPVGERLIGTLAATAACALAGARIYRVHEVVETRQVVDMVRSIAGHRPPARMIRGLA
jgi:dihydropteroate synthase